MLVTSYCNHLFQNYRDLYQFLSARQQELIEKDQTQIVSLSLKIDQVDPLTVLHQIAQPGQQTFYFEKQEFSRGIAIAAIDAVAQYQAAGCNRFQAVQQFIQSTLSNTITAGNPQLPFAGPHFFCNFTFFDRTPNGINQFPAASVFLPRWQISRHNEMCTVVANLAIQSITHLESVVEQLWRTVEAIQSIQYRLPHSAIRSEELLHKQDVIDTDYFKRAVRSTLKLIHNQSLHKVVLAHAVDVRSSLPFCLTDSLHNLRTLYPDCYIFATHNGKGQTFMGASPERLVSLRDRQLMTDALAGSAPRGKTTCEDAYFASSLLNSTKELHEHQVVIDFIKRRLLQLGLLPQLSPLRLLQLSNIQHLHTPIHATVPKDTHLLDIVAELHPTPAVAGLPRELACEHLDRLEAFERSLYAAPIGWVDHQGNGEFAVGIRSALIHGSYARLFAGAGIVAGSDPDRELAEVQLKLQALLAALI